MHCYFASLNPQVLINAGSRKYSPLMLIFVYCDFELLKFYWPVIEILLKAVMGVFTSTLYIFAKLSYYIG